MPKIKLATTLEISVPNNVKVISNGEWITLAKKHKDGKVQVFTCLNSEINNIDLNEEKSWLFLTKDELKKIAAL